ncbi:MAG: hypothetical protein H6704_21260 [Myxococcales bacterium]|nr:hypothetical protein [Myxococcales bacterium]
MMRPDDQRARPPRPSNPEAARRCSALTLASALLLAGCVTDFPAAAPCQRDLDCVDGRRCLPQADGQLACVPPRPFRAGDAFLGPGRLPGGDRDAGRIGRGPTDAAPPAPPALDAAPPPPATGGRRRRPPTPRRPRVTPPWTPRPRPLPDAAPPPPALSEGGCPIELAGERVPGFVDGRVCLDEDYCVYEYVTEPPAASCDDLCADFGLACLSATYTAGLRCQVTFAVDCAIPALRDLMCVCEHPSP